MYTLTVSIGRNVNPDLLKDFGVPEGYQVVLDEIEWESFKDNVSFIMDALTYHPAWVHTSRYSDVNTYDGNDEDSYTIMVTFNADITEENPDILNLLGRNMQRYKERYSQQAIFMAYGHSELI